MSTIESSSPFPPGGNIVSKPGPPFEGGTLSSGLLVPGFTFFSPEQSQGRYQTYHGQNAYFYSEGLVVAPVAGPRQEPRLKAQVIRLRAPYGFRIFSWYVERVRLKPRLPHPAPPDPTTEVFLAAEVYPSPPELEAGANMHNYTVRGVYYYGLLVPAEPGLDTLRMGATPYDVTPAAENVYGPGDYTNTLQ